MSVIYMYIIPPRECAKERHVYVIQVCKSAARQHVRCLSAPVCD